MFTLDDSVKRAFMRIGCSVIVVPARRSNRYSIDLENRRGRERFVVRASEDSPVGVSVLHRDDARRHLLLLVKNTGQDERSDLHRYVCGHDERHWFVAAVPGLRGTPTTVMAALEALKPDAVRQASKSLRTKDLQRRSNDAFIRQGEWFFLPSPHALVDERLILRHEPLRRGRGKAHDADELVRMGGTTVYVSRRYPNGISAERYCELMRRKTEPASAWRSMRANPDVFVRGRIRHPDHATVVLSGWHRVFTNTESQAPFAEAMTFLD